MAEETVSPLPIHHVPILDIALINRQRKELDPAKLRLLADDIERVGLLHPVVLRPPHPGEDSKGKPWVLMVGGRRLAAHIILGRSQIEARFRDDLSPIEARIAELSENVQRENITWQEEVDARAEIAELTKQVNPEADQGDIAAVVGVSEAQLSKDLALHRAVTAAPHLRSHESKGAALRAAVYTQELDRRIASVKATSVSSLKEKLFTADGRDFIRAVKDHSIDLVFSDLPYGIDYYENIKSESAATTSSEYDDSAASAKDFIADVVPQCLRVVKPGGWVVFFMCYEWHMWLQQLIHDTCITHWDYCDAGSPDDRLCQNGHFLPEKPPWIWTRRGKGNHGHWPEVHASNRYEMIVVVNGGTARLSKKPVENVLDFAPFSGERLHAMQKPHDLCCEIIERCTVVGERVLDICMGSGAHLAAAASLGRDFLGCDKNPNNLSAAITLVAQHQKKETPARGALSLV